MIKHALKLIFFIPLFLIACAKPLPQDKTDYAGVWLSKDQRVALQITPEGRIEYINEQPNSSSSISAPIHSFEGSDFIVGFGPFKTTFKVTQSPQQNDQGEWSMVVDQNVLWKK